MRFITVHTMSVSRLRYEWKMIGLKLSAFRDRIVL